MKLTSGAKQRTRRISALLRLQNQLKSGTKNVAEYSGKDLMPIQRKYPLTDKDITRIKREISILEQLIG